MCALRLWMTWAIQGLCSLALRPALRSPQKYAEEVLSAANPSQPPPPPLQHFLEQPVQRVQQYQALLKVRWPLFALCPLPMTGGACPDLLSSQELIRNKARNQQNCALLEQAYAVVSALPQRAENQLHVSLMENYPGTLEALGEPIRQVWGSAMGGGQWGCGGLCPS